MKILLPFQDPYNNPLTHPVVSGGTEMFCKAINDNFDTEVHQVPIESVDYSLKQKNQIAKDQFKQNIQKRSKLKAIGVKKFMKSCARSMILI